MPTQSKNWRDCTKPPVNNKMTATTAIMIGNMTDTFLVNAEKIVTLMVDPLSVGVCCSFPTFGRILLPRPGHVALLPTLV
ncbi:hypothetical protein GCM10009628_18100 [Paeniglutamicibacter kerguelensis]